ncbi:hypothetical protein AMAG_06765 [Allomyces macrogynus ATCC 38327]|uniref:Saccharopine dehydrogenase [NAD(+), L-lysine-forming] n=1 Tax=Allomyces macrogynus (strain ATCC 38327) TaxID=578462 RepID=A0A0L0SF00_ALLM3|nr:hypothetical protein AMAG_06765 [Allomyces macrogynus ATCC 38327]|eukprot:KNE61004.1 hypothetical protein AMAG_06765 [Allomyces macrogynus ATCC 38327]
MSITTAPNMPHLWLRSEKKAMEHRCALTPSHARALLAAEFQITVERSPARIFDDAEYAALGCPLVDEHSWQTDAPKDAIILGLKEFPDEDSFALSHRHILFAHCYKHQDGWQNVLDRFQRGNGTLYDLEFLNDPDSGRRVAAFGFQAGFAGAAVGLDVWASKTEEEATNFPAIHAYPNEDLLLTHIRARLAATGRDLPRVLVMGALGRCGRGAVAFLTKAGIPLENITQWDIAETRIGGPFPTIANDHDIFINCIYLTTKIPPFLTQAHLDAPERRLTTVVDVSCDPNSPNNPLPFYNVHSTFASPTVRVPAEGGAVHVVAIDHLPSLLPRESSEKFVEDLMPSLRALKVVDAELRGYEAEGVSDEDVHMAKVWRDAEVLFHSKLAELDADRAAQA